MKTAFPDTEEGSAGMSLRDYFAGQALSGCLADPELAMKQKQITEWCYSTADAMLKARGGGE